MLLHSSKSSKVVTFDDVCDIATPANTRTHYPISHRLTFDLAWNALEKRGIKPISHNHVLSHDGSSYFGLIESNGNDGANLVIGVRNDHNKRFAAGMVAGSSVLVCDNLCFSGDVSISRKHTRRAEIDLRHRIYHAVGDVVLSAARSLELFEQLKKSEVRDDDAFALIVRSVREGACTKRKAFDVVEEYLQPSYPEHQPGNLYSLMQAFTHVEKGSNLEAFSYRSRKLTRLFEETLAA